MFKEANQGQIIKPILGENGKPLSGMFSFDSLPDDPIIEEQINQFILEEQKNAIQEKIDESNKKIQELLQKKS